MMPYVQAFDIARIALRYQRQRGRKYFDGVERAAALAAISVAIPTKKAFVDAMEIEFMRHLDHAPNWDGSIA